MTNTVLDEYVKSKSQEASTLAACIQSVVTKRTESSRVCVCERKLKLENARVLGAVTALFVDTQQKAF